MSAVNIFRQTDAVHVVTDGYAIDDTAEPGTGAYFAVPKVFPLPHLNAVVAARGVLLAPWLMAMCIARSGDSYDAAKQRAVQSARDCAGSLANLPRGGLFEFYVAGFSETTGADSYCVTSSEATGVPVWQVVDLGTSSFAPSDQSVLDEMQRGLPANLRTLDDLDPEREGLRVLELQRARHFTGVDSVERMNIGCFAQITTVTRDAITTRILRRWPDEIGKRTGPAPARPVASATC